MYLKSKHFPKQLTHLQYFSMIMYKISAVPWTGGCNIIAKVKQKWEHELCIIMERFIRLLGYYCTKCDLADRRANDNRHTKDR